MKSVAFILWQRLANEAARVRMTLIVEERNSLLEKKEEELEATKAESQKREEEWRQEKASEAKKNLQQRAVLRLGEVMEEENLRKKAYGFNRWNWTTVKGKEARRVTEEKEREKTQVVEAMKAEALKEKEEHEQAIVALKSRQEERSVCDGCVRCSDEKEECAGHTECDAASAPSEDGCGGGGVEGASQSAEGEEREGRGPGAATV